MRRSGKGRGPGSVAALGLGGLCLLAACGGPAPPRPANLLLIAVDTLRADHLGVYGCPRGTSPRLDAFAEGAVVFDDAQSSAPWTLPSFATLLTSLPPLTHRAVSWNRRLDGSFHTLAEVLQEAGYETAAIVSHTPLASVFGLNQGFDVYDESRVDVPGKTRDTISSPGVTDRAIALLDTWSRKGAERPWFLWTHYFDPHSAYLPHEGFTERFTGGRHPAAPRDLYDGEIAFTDAHIGRLLDAVDSLGLAKRTVVAVVADHGEEFFDHGSTGHGKTLYRELVHVPFLIRAPGIEPRRVGGLVRLLDFVPTVLDLLGIDATGESFEGRSLVPVMRGDPLEPRGVLLHTGMLEAGLLGYARGRWKIVGRPAPHGEERPGGGESAAAPRGDPPFPPGRFTFELYDREKDASEQENVADLHPGAVAKAWRRVLEEAREARRKSAAFPGTGELVLPDSIRDMLDALGYAR